MRRKKSGDLCIRNDRLWRAMNVLACGEGDVRERVSDACQLLEGINPREMPLDSYLQMKSIIDEVGRDGPLVSNADGSMLIDKFKNTSKRRKNKTYTTYARRIWKLYEAIQFDADL
jgi:hypothetical protein